LTYADTHGRIKLMCAHGRLLVLQLVILNVDLSDTQNIIYIYIYIYIIYISYISYIVDITRY